MKTLQFLLQKEFRQIFRNPAILRLIIAMPFVQLLVLPLAADFETKNINIAVVNEDFTPYSQTLISKIVASGYFVLVSEGTSHKEAMSYIEQDKADLILEIPNNFEKDLSVESSAQLLIMVNAINGMKANVGAVYLSQIIGSFNQQIRIEQMPATRFNPAPVIETAPQFWYNKFLNYRIFMVPGILVLLVTMVGSFMSALNLVKEKEVGTIEQINVTPIRKIHFILGKLIPFWIIGMFVFSIGLFIIGMGIYGIVPIGNIGLLYAYLAIYLVAVLGVGLLISTYANTQQQAMSLAYFFMMIFILMSGLFTPIDGMPQWAQYITKLNPVTWFIEVMRMVVMKGSGFEHIKTHFLVMIGFALFINTWAVLNYKKTS